MFIIFEYYVTIKEKVMETRFVTLYIHPVDANWRKNIIRSMGNRFAAVHRLYDVYLQSVRVCARLDGGG